MASFTYTARDNTGAAVNGTIAANTIQEVTKLLRAEGKYPTAIRPTGQADGAAGSPQISGRGIKISRADLIQMATQLAIMMETGVTLSEALDCIAAQSDKPNVKKLVDDLCRNVNGGSDFSAALARHPRSFPRLFIALIKAAEKSGMMSRLLGRATNYLRDEQDTIRRVRGALIYPGFMLTFAITTTIFLLAFVMPKFTVIYANKKAALPAPTKILMTISDFIVGHWAILLTSVIVIGVGGFFYFFRTKSGSRIWDWIQLRVPLLGAMFRKLHLSRGLRMVGTMAGAGVNLVDCVSTAHDLCGNVFYRDLWSEVSEQIQSGKQLSEPLFRSKLVPRSVAQMISSGEKSGKLAFVMEQVSGFAEAELKEKIVELTRYIEPIMIMLMGFIIGGIALALLLPVFTISKVIAN